MSTAYPDPISVALVVNGATASRHYSPPPPELISGRVGIRPFEARDAAELFAAARESGNELCKWMVWCRPDYTREECAEFVSGCDTKWRQGESYNFVIFDTTNGGLLGSVAINHINWEHLYGNVAYWVRTNRAGQGVGSAAVQLVARFGFFSLGLSRLELVIQVENCPSRRVAEKVGAGPEGLLKHRLLMHGQPCDAVMYSLLSVNVIAESDRLPSDRSELELSWIR